MIGFDAYVQCACAPSLQIAGGAGFVEAQQVSTTTAMTSTEAKKFSLLRLMTVLELRKIRS